MEVAAGLFFTTSSSSGLLTRAQQEHRTPPSADPHIAHSCVNKEREGGSKDKGEEEEGDLIQTRGGISGGERMRMACCACRAEEPRMKL